MAVSKRAATRKKKSLFVQKRSASEHEIYKSLAQFFWFVFDGSDVEQASEGTARVLQWNMGPKSKQALGGAGVFPPG